MAWFYLFIFTPFFLSARAESNADWKLVMANVLYRHGDRSPEHTFPNDEHKDYWKQGLGQLTELGMSQEFSMGKFLKRRYLSKLVNQEYLRKQVYCRSSDKDRTLMSAEAQMAGLYPPIVKKPLPKQKNWQFWQLIPIHTVPKQYDQLLQPYSYDCPRLKKIQEESFNDPEYVKMERKNKRFLARISKNLGLNESEYLTLDTQYTAYDMFFCQRAHNLSWPEWMTQHDFDRMARMKQFSFDWMFKTPEKSRLTGGNLLGEMIENMKFFKNDPDNSKKLFVYSAHDTTIAALLSALKVYSGIPPPYSTAFMMEMYHHKPSSKSFVRMFLRNDTSLPHTAYELAIPGCQGNRHKCPLHKFIKLTRSAIPINFDAECHKNCPQAPAKENDHERDDMFLETNRYQDSAAYSRMTS